MTPTQAQQQLLRILASFDCSIVWQRRDDNRDRRVEQLPAYATFPEDAWWHVNVEKFIRSWFQPAIRLPTLWVLRDRDWITEVGPRSLPLAGGGTIEGNPHWVITDDGLKAWDKVTLDQWPERPPGARTRWGIIPEVPKRLARARPVVAGRLH